VHVKQGIVYKGRRGRKLSAQKEAFAREAEDAALAEEAGTDLGRAVRLVRPCSLIGAAAKGAAFTAEVLGALVQVQS
jgi:malic enzyme